MDKTFVTHENAVYGATLKGLRTSKEIAMALSAMVPAAIPNEYIYFLCIGTDRSTGDAYGPIIGTNLKKLKIPNVVGDLHCPAHAQNLQERAAEIPEDSFIIAVDAALGLAASVGTAQVVNGPLIPGAGVGKDLGKYGDVSISGMVNVGGFMEYFVLQNTRLSLVMDMAGTTTAGILQFLDERKEVKTHATNNA